MSSNSDYKKVLQFTVGAKQPTTTEPTPMNHNETYFLIRMLLSELQELAMTIANSNTEAVQVLRKALDEIDVSKFETFENDDELCAAQVDAVVDMWYYSLNAMSKKCIDASQVFDIVHDANMAKRDPTTNQFVLREDGKIIKPAGWSPPDIVQEIRRQRSDARRNIALNQFHNVYMTDERLNGQHKCQNYKTIKAILNQVDYLKHGVPDIVCPSESTTDVRFEFPLTNVTVEIPCTNGTGGVFTINGNECDDLNELLNTLK